MSSANVAIAAFVNSEALALDERRWDDWLGHYAPECEYWVPAWKSEEELTSHPRRELSLIYYSSRAGLADRVWRVKSGRSNASAVLPRTQHNISNLLVHDVSDASATLSCNWIVHQYQPRDKAIEMFFGRYEFTLTLSHERWHIARKKIVLLNDQLPAKLDFYSL